MEVRQPSLDFTGVDPVWSSAHRVAHFFNAVGIVPAHLEPFLIRVMRRARDRLDPVVDAQLLHDVDVFCRQEGQHYRFHQALNRWVRDHGYPDMDGFEARCRHIHETMLASWSLPRLLAYCEGFEALGLLTAGPWIDGRMQNLVPDADPRVVALWRWHLAEEYEHRSVVFDVLRRVCGRSRARFYLLRVAGVFAVLRRLGPIVVGLARYLREVPRDVGRPRSPGNAVPARRLLRGQIRPFAALLSPRYDPAAMPAPRGLSDALAIGGTRECPDVDARGAGAESSRVTDLPAQPRIAPTSDDDEQRRLNIFRTLARNRPLYKGFLALGGHLLRGGGLPARERELVILRTGFRAGSEYEFGQHTRLGREAGLTSAEISALAGVSATDWNDDDRALVSMVDELCADDVVSEPTWRALTSRWTEEQLLELLVLSGYYRLVSGLLNSVGVALERETPGWPDGAAIDRRAPREGRL